jgi:DinB superfamily
MSVLEPIAFARRYTLRLLEDLGPDDWFRMPQGVTHIAWQVGHLAFAEYRLVLERVRGIRPDDAELLPAEFLRHFGRDSVPAPDPAHQPRPEEIRAVFDRVHERVLAELKDFPEAELGDAMAQPHRLAKTKLESLFWCAHHEMMHAGQIGLLRRLFGHAPQW